MKSTLKLMNFKKLLFLPLIALALMLSCQTEETDIVNPSQEDIITASSTTANLMAKTASNDGSTDNIIDFANCLEVVLPVTVTANGVTITIEAFDDYDALEDILDAFINDNDEVVITFPITVILNDYTEIVINSQEELEAQIELCNGENEEDDDIECIDFQYPIAFSIYNTDFQVIETVTIENDEALYNFLETLDGPILASLNFPVTMILSDGNTLEVNTNEELDAAIEAAEDDCDEDDDYDWNDDDEYDECTEQSVELALKECLWYIDLFNNSSELEGFDLDFTENYDLFVYNSQTGNVEAQGSWSVALDGDYLYLNIDVAFEGIGGNWKVIECYNDELELIRNQDTMILQQDCDNNTDDPFACFTSFDAILEKCDDNGDGIEEFDLTITFDNCLNPSQINVSYHETQADAQANMNALATPMAYSNIVNPQTIYARVELIANASEFEVYPIELIVEDCGNGNTCNETEVDAYLVECIWNVVAFNDDDNLINFNLEFNNSGEIIITNTVTNDTYTGTWATSTISDGVKVEFNASGPEIQAISGNWLVVDCASDRLEFESINSTDTMVIEQNCN